MGLIFTPYFNIVILFDNNYEPDHLNAHRLGS